MSPSLVPREDDLARTKITFRDDYEREKDIELSKELYVAYPQNVDFKNNLAIAYEKIGATHTALGNLDQALTFFEDYNKLENELYADYPQFVQFKNNLAISYQFLGNAHTALGNLDQALTFFENYNSLSKELYGAYPQNVDFKNGLAISHAQLGVFSLEQLKDKAKAKAYFQQAEALYVELVRDAPQYAQFQQYLELVRQDLAGLD
ncbi:MAG: tetratricopeptide repeat protein [Saprospiraceae bacterium]|nr:tetratricopeptide repeat protein [Saprospiraceae bacterium]